MFEELLTAEGDRRASFVTSSSRSTCRWSSTWHGDSATRGEPLDDLVQVATIGSSSPSTGSTSSGASTSTNATPTIGASSGTSATRAGDPRAQALAGELKLALTKASAELSPAQRSRADRRRAREAPRAHRGGDPRGPRVRQRRPRSPWTPPMGETTTAPRSPTPWASSIRRSSGVPRVPQAAARQAGPPREEDPHAPLLRRHDPVPDRRCSLVSQVQRAGLRKCPDG